MVRTQIYLTHEEQSGLLKLAEQTGRKKSEIIREAVDSLLAREAPQSRIGDLRKARGLWVDRPDNFLTELRREADREFPQ